MIKRLLIGIAISLSLLPASAQYYYYQYFDGADTVFSNSVNIFIEPAINNIWHITTPQKVIFNSAATQPNVIVTDTSRAYPNNNYSSFIIKILPPGWGYGIWALQWKQKLDIEADYDGGMIEMTIDGGNTWENVFGNPYVYNFYGFDISNQDTLVNYNIPCFSGTDSLWKDVWLCFDMSWLGLYSDTIMFRYSFFSDGVNTQQEGWMIDNFYSHLTFVHTVNESEIDDYIRLYPNPASDFLTIETRKINEFHIIKEMDLIDINGKIIQSWKNIPVKFWIDIRRYNSGNYFLKIKTNIKTEVLPFTITR